MDMAGIIGEIGTHKFPEYFLLSFSICLHTLDLLFIFYSKFEPSYGV